MMNVLEGSFIAFTISLTINAIVSVLEADFASPPWWMKIPKKGRFSIKITSAIMTVLFGVITMLVVKGLLR